MPWFFPMATPSTVAPEKDLLVRKPWTPPTGAAPLTVVVVSSRAAADDRRRSPSQ